MVTNKNWNTSTSFHDFLSTTKFCDNLRRPQSQQTHPFAILQIKNNQIVQPYLRLNMSDDVNQYRMKLQLNVLSKASFKIMSILIWEKLQQFKLPTVERAPRVKNYWSKCYLPPYILKNTPHSFRNSALCTGRKYVCIKIYSFLNLFTNFLWNLTPHRSVTAATI